MEHVGAREQVQYAGLGWRVAAVAVDTVVLFFLLMVIFAVMVALGAFDPRDPAFSGRIDIRRTAPLWMYAITYGLVFVYYTLFESLTAASVGKLVFHMRVTTDDGAKPPGLAVVVRNLVRLPEVLFWYVPSGISCLSSARNKRLGDLAARTVVVRRSAAPIGGAAPGPVQAWASAPLPHATPPRQIPPARGLAPTPPPPSPAGTASAPPGPDASEALARLKTAALAVRGAHLNYLSFSEVELAKDEAGGRRVSRRPSTHPSTRPPGTHSPTPSSPCSRRMRPRSRPRLASTRRCRPSAPVSPTSRTSSASSSPTSRPARTSRYTRRT